MRTYDLSPLYRSTVGFDRLANIMENVLTTDTNQNTYPPYNIVKTDDNTYRITLALAGFTDDDLNIEAREGQLIVSGKKSTADKETEYLHQGIANRAFERRFQMADHVRAVSASSENGLLHVDLVREVPEALKPRKIEIKTSKEIQVALNA